MKSSYLSPSACKVHLPAAVMHNAKIRSGMKSEKGHKDINSVRCILMLDLFCTELHNNPCEVMTAVHI